MRRSLGGWVAACVLAASPCLGAPASEGDREVPPIDTNRPDFSEAAIVVPRGSVQLESGFTVIQDRRQQLLDGPELLVRWGFSRRTELLLVPPDLVGGSGPGANSGTLDTQLGLKQQLGPLAGFDVTLTGYASLPTGSVGISSGAVDPIVAFAWRRELTEQWSLNGTFLFAWPTQQDDPTLPAARNLTTLTSFVVNRQLGGPWAAFLEYAGFVADHGRNIHFAHQGVTYALGRRAQLDAHAGVGLTSESPDYFFGAGYSVRFDR